jgi:glycosyltransferase domain-containing protein
VTDSYEYPLISIGIPTMNSRGCIYQTLVSILSQNYPNLEIIISDDCSADNTEELCTEMGKRYPSIRYVRQKENIGLVQNFDYVLKVASGEFFMWCADDDTLEPGILFKYVHFLMNNPAYTLVSGKILYWSNHNPVFYEQDLSMESNLRLARVINYYFKVVHGAVYYGLMRKSIAERIPQRSRIGDDWHFVATLAFLGKIKNLDCIGYNKKLGGTSNTFEQYAEAIGASSFSARFPHLQIAMDAFSEIVHESPAYLSLPGIGRFFLAFFSSTAVLLNFYMREYPFIIGGRIKRSIKKMYQPVLSSLQKTRTTGS